jgi:bidirectional [NiFe] hydrogenase diaphorase subunit
VANNHCELQSAGYDTGMEHVRFSYLFPEMRVDSSHKSFVVDHNRCILCTRCVRACREVEGAYTWDVQGRGIGSNIISDLNQPWGDAATCTGCGKCVEVCPTGALWRKDEAQGQMDKDSGLIARLMFNRKAKL